MPNNKLREELNEAKGLDGVKELFKDRPGIALPYYYQTVTFAPRLKATSAVLSEQLCAMT